MGCSGWMDWQVGGERGVGDWPCLEGGRTEMVGKGGGGLKCSNCRKGGMFKRRAVRRFMGRPKMESNGMG